MIREPNYTQIPNEFLDNIMPTLSGAENVVFLVIMRKTFGWHKKKDKISYSQIREGSGISSNTTIQTALKKLQEKGLIFIVKEKKGITYEVNITETVNEENEDLYKNCKDTFTETVNIKDKTFTESVNTKESNINKLSKEIYEEIEKAYESCFFEVKPSGKLLIDYPRIRKRIKELLERITKDEIISVIQNAKSDDWIKDNGFQFSTILSDFQVSKLLNGKNSKGTPIPKQSLKDAPKCPKCGSVLSSLFCENCMIQFNGKLEEI